MKVVIVRSKSPAELEPRIARTATALSKAGYSVEIVLWDRECIHSHLEECAGYKIIRYSRRAPYGRPRLLLEMLFWWWFEFWYLLRSDATVVHACDFDTVLPAIGVKFLRAKKLVYDIFDFYAHMIAVNLSSFLRTVLAHAERCICQFADLVIIVDECRKEQLEGAKIRNLVCVMNTPEEIEISAQKNRGRFMIFYAGIIAFERGLKHILDAVKGLENVEFIVAGYGPDEKSLLPLIAQQPNAKYLGMLPYPEVLKWEARSDLMIAYYDPSLPNNRYASPNKLFEAMMLSKPIIVSAGTAMAKIVAEENNGNIVEYGDVETLRNIILELSISPALSAELGQNGRKAFEQKYNWPVMRKRLLAAYKQSLMLR